MPLLYTTEDLITTVENRSMIPAVDSEGSGKDDIVRYLNEELWSTILPELFKYHEDYLINTEHVSIVSGQTHYRIPARASGNTLRDLMWLNSASERRILPYIRRESRGSFDGTLGQSSVSVGTQDGRPDHACLERRR